MTERVLQLRTVLDPASHGVLQLAVMAFARRSIPSLALLEDVRLALDEVLLAEVVVAEPIVEIEVTLRDDAVTIVVEIASGDVRVDEVMLSALVDDVIVESGEATRITLCRDLRPTS